MGGVFWPVGGCGAVVEVVVKSCLLSVCLPSLAWFLPVGAVSEWGVWGVVVVEVVVKSRPFVVRQLAAPSSPVCPLSVCLPSLAWSWPVGVVGEWCVGGGLFACGVCGAVVGVCVGGGFCLWGQLVGVCVGW